MTETANNNTDNNQQQTPTNGEQTTTITITAQMRLAPTAEQANMLAQTRQAYLNALNHASQHAYKTGKTTKTALHEDLYYELRNTHGIGAQMACSVIKEVTARYKARKTQAKKRAKDIKKNKNRKNVKKRKRLKPKAITFKKEQIALVWNRDYTINLKRCEASINSLNGRQKMEVRLEKFYQQLERYGINECRFGTARLVLRDGKWFLHAPITVKIPVRAFSACDDVVGVDTGLRFLFSAYRFSDGARLYIRGTRLMGYRAHVQRKTQELKAKRSPLTGKRSRSVRRRLASMRGRENRFASEACHIASKALAAFARTPNTLFAFEDLSGIRDRTEIVGRKRRYQQVSWPFSRLVGDACYKAVLLGHSAVLVSPVFTSQRCPRCGCVSGSNRVRARHELRCCVCGFTGNDDGVAAVNVGLVAIANMLRCSIGDTPVGSWLTGPGVSLPGGFPSMSPLPSGLRS